MSLARLRVYHGLLPQYMQGCIISEVEAKELMTTAYDEGRASHQRRVDNDDMEVYVWLRRSPQCYPKGMSNTLRHTATCLLTQELLGHPNPDVRVAVTACLAEITRIDAPEVPYDDEVMKDVSKRVVETFADLDDMDSRFFAWRASILDSAARVRLCILMLDLDLEHLILDMFHHLFKAISSSHSEHDINSMETLMVSAIQESDSVPVELASCLLQNLKKEAPSAAFELAERVTGLCKDKIKPVFGELLKGTSLDEYSSAVTLLCLDDPDAMGNDNGNAPVDNVKFPDRSISSERAEKTVDVTPAGVKRKRNRPAVRKSHEKKPGGNKQRSDLESRRLALVSDSGGRVTRSITKQIPKSSTTRAAEGESLKMQPRDNLKLQTEDALSDDDSDVNTSFRAPLPKKIKTLDEILIGSRIKVWWPDEKMFYAGLVTSFDACSKRHKVVYDDGDVEILLLNNEQWEFIVEKQGSNSDANTTSDTPRGRRAKGSLQQKMKEEKTRTPKSDGRDPPKKRGRPKGARSRTKGPVTSARLKGERVEKDAQETPRTGSNLKR